MSRTEYEWSSIENPPIISRPSLNKHKVLEEYLHRYLNKLYSRAREYLRFSIVDGFAGGGIYRRPDNREIHFGSPVRIMRLVEKAPEKLANAYKKEVEFKPRYYFVEKNKNNFNVLKQVLKDQGLNPIVDNKGGLIHGDFKQEISGIIRNIKSEGRAHKAVFLLDQYGYTDVPIDTIREIFHSLPDAEVILTFAVDWLIDYLTNKPDLVESRQTQLRNIGIYTAVPELVGIKSKGGQSRFLIQDILGRQLSSNCGAKYFTRYFIRTENKSGKQSHRDIWLVHMSQHPVAHDEMLRVHWDSANEISTHAGFQGIDDRGFRLLGYSTKSDESLGQLNLHHNFDETAKRESVDILLRQLPGIIWEQGPMTFADLMKLLANHMPADSDIIRKVLNILLTHKDIEVRSPNGVQRRIGNSVERNDLIIPRHLSIFNYQD